MDAFEQTAAEVLQAIAGAIDEAAPDCDCENKGDGVLEITLPDDSRVIVNRHSPAREIWVATRTGGYHFRQDGAAWIDTRSHVELFRFLSDYLTSRIGEPVSLRH